MSGFVITTVTLNAAIDKTYYLDELKLSKVNRGGTMHAIPGGKGLNVARVIRTLGYPVMTTGLLAGTNGEFIRRELRKAGIPNDFVMSDSGESRLCLNFMSVKDGSSTEFLESGPEFGEDDWRQVSRKVAECAARSKIVVLSGSLPPGLSSDAYAELVGIVKRHGAVAFLDTSGPALSAGIRAVPFLIKPNEDEIRQYLGTDDLSEPVLLDGVRRLMRDGISRVIVTLGEAGSLAGWDGRCYRVKAPRVAAVNAVGCGDSFVAGMAAACYSGWSAEKSLRYATAAATANALTELAGHVRPADLDRLVPQVQVELIG